MMKGTFCDPYNFTFISVQKLHIKITLTENTVSCYTVTALGPTQK